MHIVLIVLAVILAIPLLFAIGLALSFADGENPFQ